MMLGFSHCFKKEKKNVKFDRIISWSYTRDRGTGTEGGEKVRKEW